MKFAWDDIKNAANIRKHGVISPKRPNCSMRRRWKSMIGGEITVNAA